MAKQTLVFESPVELSLKEGMIVITDKDKNKSTLRSLEDIQLVMIDHYSVRISVPLITEFSKYNIAVVCQDSNAFHCLNRKHTKSLEYGKYDNVEFF